MEYLTEGFLRGTAPLLIGLTTQLRSKGYTEWDAETQKGYILAAGFDWRSITHLLHLYTLQLRTFELLCTKLIGHNRTHKVDCTKLLTHFGAG